MINHFFRSHTLLKDVSGRGYGRLYTFPCTQQQPSGEYIAPEGWHVETFWEFYAVSNCFGEWGTTGGHLKESRTAHWASPNTGADNASGFSAIGSGWRGSDGVFNELNERFVLWFADNTAPFGPGGDEQLPVNDDGIYGSTGGVTRGASIRLIKDDPSSWTPGDTVTDYDGNIYKTVKIGNDVYTAENWKCTRYNGGTSIPYVSDNAAWGLDDGIGKQCIWGNDPLNL